MLQGKLKIYETMLDSLLAVEYDSLATIQVMKIIYTELLRTMDTNTAQHITVNLNVSVNDAHYADEKERIDKLAIKMAHILHNMYVSMSEVFDEEMAIDMVKKFSLEFNIE